MPLPISPDSRPALRIAPHRMLRVLAFLALAAYARTAEPAWAPEEFEAISGPASPRVAVAVRSEGGQLRVAVEVASFAADGSGVRIQLGLAADATVILDERAAQVVRGASLTTCTFATPLAPLGDLRRLRLGLAIAWEGGPAGADRQRERLRHRSGAAHAGLAADPREWLPFDLTEYALAVADRRNRLEITFTQPEGGKATVVIEDAVSGRRLRNLVGGQPFAAGAQRLAWDGLDDHGAVVPPGTYRWRSLHHPGIVPEYAMSFANGDDTLAQLSGWGPNHTVLNAATASGAWTVVSAPMTEGGDAILVLDAQGHKVRGMNVPLGMGIARTASAISGDTLYVANDGPAFLDHIDERDAHAVAHLKITLARFDLAQGRLLEWKPGGSFIAVAEAETHPAEDSAWRSAGLVGLAALGDRLYLADRRGGRLLVLDAATGAQSGVFALPALAGLTSAQGRLYALAAGAVVTIDVQSGVTTTVVPAAPSRDPVALAVDAGGRIYVSDAASHTVLMFDARGQPLGALGRPGGPYTGAFDRERMVNPRGLAVAATGWLWVTEERAAPKRIVAWDTATRRVVCEKFGSPPYGGTGAGVDPVDPTRWIGLGAQWRIDLATRTAQPIAIVGPDHHEFHYSYVRDHGVTYLIGYGQATTIARVNGDGSATPVALIASAHRFSFACDWQPPAAFVTAFAAAYPGRAGKHADKGPGFVWSDANGDGVMQPGEFDFATSAESFAGAYFGHDQHDLTLRVPVTVGGRRVVVALAPSGFTAGDAPRYPSLAAACSAGVPIDLPGNEVETTVDRFGDLICNAEPELKAFAPDGRLLWTHPNRWVGVHGSHDAPLPETGVMQGALGFMGTAPLDATSDVFVMNGNHGRYFMLTSDGLYVDEFFKDVRMGAHLDTTLVGGEAFGGCFARGERDGVYYLQVGGYRVYRMRGLDRLQRGQGAITVSPAQAIAAERAMAAHGAIAAKPHAAIIPLVAQAPALPGEDHEWPAPAAAWDRSGRFPVRVRAAHDGRMLYLRWEVADDSPWVNRGGDWTLLFKSGDSVDLQLGTDAAANPARSGPVPGDLRLLIAPFQGKDIAVLYRHRLPGATEPVTFTSPWRAERVDEVRRLDSARIAVTVQGGGYRVSVAIPLADLGLDAVAGRTVKADFGVIYGDPEGRIDMLRSYWANPSTGLVNDVPGEIMLTPAAWGTATFASAP